MTAPLSGNQIPLVQAVVYQDGVYQGRFGLTRNPYDANPGAPGRYTQYNEIPPGSYHASPKPGYNERIQIGDQPGGNTIDGSLAGENYSRSDIQFHPAINAEGCMTFPASKFERVKGESFDNFANILEKDFAKGEGVRIFVLGQNAGDSKAERNRNVRTIVNFLQSPGFLGR